MQIKLAAHQSEEAIRAEQVSILEEEVASLTTSLAAGVDPVTVREQINWRAERLKTLKALAGAPLPKKITEKDLEVQVREARQATENRDPNRRHMIIRKYIAAMEADPESRIVRVLMKSFDSVLFPNDGSARGS